MRYSPCLGRLPGFEPTNYLPSFGIAVCVLRGTKTLKVRKVHKDVHRKGIPSTWNSSVESDPFHKKIIQIPLVRGVHWNSIRKESLKPVVQDVSKWFPIFVWLQFKKQKAEESGIIFLSLLRLGDSPVSIPWTAFPYSWLLFGIDLGHILWIHKDAIGDAIGGCQWWLKLQMEFIPPNSTKIPKTDWFRFSKIPLKSRIVRESRSSHRACLARFCTTKKDWLNYGRFLLETYY